MDTQAQAVEEVSGRPISVHRGLVLEKSCDKYGCTPCELRASSKLDPQWTELAGIVAHLLKRDTGATDRDVAKMIGTEASLVGRLTGRIAAGIAYETSGNNLGLSLKIADITDAVLEAIDAGETPQDAFEEVEDEPVPNAFVYTLPIYDVIDIGPAKSDAMHIRTDTPQRTERELSEQRVAEAIEQEGRSIGVTVSMLQGRSTIRKMVQYRDVWIYLLLSKQVGLSERAVRLTTRRDHHDLARMMDRMRRTSLPNTADDTGRQEILAALCSRLNISADEVRAHHPGL